MTRTKRERRRWSRSTKVLVAVGASVVVAWAAVVALTLLGAYRHDRSGLGALAVVRARLSASSVTGTGMSRQLTAAESQFVDAHRALVSWWMAPLSVVPVLGRQLQSVTDLSGASATIASTGASFVNEVHAVLDAPHAAGPERVAALRRLSTAAGAAARVLDRVSTGPSGGLVAPLAAKRDQLVSQLEDARGRLARAAVAAGAAATILEGPQTYLVLASNNAEMRAGSGAFLEVGTATMSGGSVHLGQMLPAGSLFLPKGAVTLTGDLARNWGWLAPNQEWRNLGVTPQFDVTAELAARMWKARTGQQVDGVVSLDVVGLQHLLEATGPVSAGGVTVSASNALSYLLHGQYAGLTDNATPGASSRQDALGALASATLHELEGGSLDLRTLATAMSAAAEGRHLMVWSRAPAAEAAWRATGVSGELGPRSLDVAVINRGGNKLDPYLGVGVSMTTRPAGASTDVTLRVTLHNTTPPGQSQFIAGPYPGLAASYGEYVGLLAVNVPARATHRRVSGGLAEVVDAAEGPTWLLVSSVDVLPGRSTTLEVRFELPGRHGTVHVVPSARVPPEVWHVPGRSFRDSLPQSVSW
ncbi:MAG: DUF4012 domain-containing protein [Actinomycetota bacterium]|nr:DUF4012 domain-containing protein [Actinomycetota bacterium]